MDPIPGFPYFPIQFDKKGRRAAQDDAEFKALQKHLAEKKPSDLIVISHGWNNDMAEADALYAELLSNAKRLIDDGKIPGLAGRTFAVLGVLWPSKKFADEELIPSGAAGLAGVVRVAQVANKLDDLRGVFDAPDANDTLAQMKSLLPRLDDSDKACQDFVNLARRLAPHVSRDNQDGADRFFKAPAADIFEAMQRPVSFVEKGIPTTPGGIAEGFGNGIGDAAGLGDFFSGALSGARNVLNLTTYYQMKERAGLIGAEAVNPLLHDLRAQHPTLRVHLIGHSFGGRLVTAIAAGKDDGTVFKVNSISLLQAAFSHYGFAENWDGSGGVGFFRRVIDGNAVSGPVIITCTEADRAVGLAYPLASLLAGQNASGLGDKDSKFGGLGRNGAQKSAAIESVIVKVGQAYSLVPGRLNNLRADGFISNHGDVRNPAVAYATFSAIAAG